MTSIDFEQLNKNSRLFLAVRETKTSEFDKLDNVNKCLQDGADVNAADANYNNNTSAHIAVITEETHLLQLLIDNNADLNIRNSTGKSPLDIAYELKSDKGRDIVDILQNATATTTKKRVVQKENPTKKPNKVSKKQKPFLYSKRTGTSGVSGQLYETKLLSLVLMRVLHDNEVVTFYIGTNINGIGDLDDICLRYEVKGHSKPILVFVQAKHREDSEKGRITVEDLRSPSGDFSLRKYFDSYLKIKERFQPKNEDHMFDGDFNSVECNLVIYTPAKDCVAKKNKQRPPSLKVHDLINTGQEAEVFQFEHDEEDVDFLTKMTVDRRIQELGTVFLQYIMSDCSKSKNKKQKTNTQNQLQMMMSNEPIARYHAVMGREVLQPLKIQPQNDLHCLWQFRPDFFTSYSEHLTLLRKTFFKELSTKRCDKSDITQEEKHNFVLMINDPCSYTIGKLIGRVITYDEKNKKLQLIEVNEFKMLFEDNELTLLKQQLETIEIQNDIIYDAVRLKLESIELQLPTSFGNLDLSIRGNEKKVNNRIKHIAEKLHPLFETNNVSKVIDIDDDTVGNTIEEGVLELNGGIASAVGNLLVYDPETKTMMLDLDSSLPDKASLLLNEFRKFYSNEELRAYRFNININGFPKISFYGDEYDKRQARHFLNILWFYANQAKEDKVEQILKNDIKNYYNNDNTENQFTFKIHSDAIFLRSHDEIQKWWMESGKVPYLNNTRDVFDQAKLAVIERPLLTVLHFMYNLKIQNIGVKFNQDALKALELDNITQRVYNVITEQNDFTGVKLMQHFGKQDKCIFIDFDYVLSLPLSDYNIMIYELQHTDEQTLIIIYDKLKYYEGLCNKLIQTINVFSGNKIVIVTDGILAQEIENFFPDKYQSVIDVKTNLIDLDTDSQSIILKESTVTFQGEEHTFGSILDQKSQDIMRADMLYKLIRKDKIEIGHDLVNEAYEEKKDDYIERTLSCENNTYEVNTLNDLNDVVIVSGPSGMGKSMLLTHLALQTKRHSPIPWIVRVNLRNYIKEFERWQDKDVNIDAHLILHFLCKVAVKNTSLSNFAVALYGGEATVSEIDPEVNPLALFELELFLHLYNCDRKVIFLFDDFSAMCSHYEKEVLEIFRFLRDECKPMWITTCAYKHTRKSLENEFDALYKLNPFQPAEKKTFIDRFFKTNLNLERLNYAQFENVKSFLKFMSKKIRIRHVDPDRELVPVISLIFHFVYLLAVQFFQSEINRVSPTVINDKMREKFDIDFTDYSPVDELLGRTPHDEDLEMADTPLHLYLATRYFKYEIEDVLTVLLDEEEAKNKFELITNTFTLYLRYAEADMKRIFSKEDVDDDSIADTYRKNRKKFLGKHKKLGLYVFIKENDLTKLLRPDEINEIENIITSMGTNPSTMIDCVVDGVPRFAHLVFAEYFAVECLTDMLKALATDTNSIKLSSLWKSILKVVLFNAPPGVRKAFDYKLKSDETLAGLANTSACRELVFELLMKERKSEEAGSSRKSVVSDALEDGLINIVNLFLSSAQGNLSRGNVDEFMQFARSSGEKFAKFGHEYAETWKHVLKSVTEMDLNRLGDILKSGRLTEVPLRHAAMFATSDAGSVLQRHVAATESQLPAVAENVQQLFQHGGTIGQNLSDLLAATVTTALSDLLTTLTQDPDSDTDED